MTAKRLDLAGLALGGVLMLIASTQRWIVLHLQEGVAAQQELELTGQQVNQALAPLGLAVIAAALALLIAGPILRRVLGVLALALGAAAAAAVIASLASLESLAVARLAEVTGVLGAPYDALVASADVGPWAYVTAGAAVVVAISALDVAVRGGSWGAAGKRYESGAAPAEPRTAAANGSPDRISDWDALSDGDDPTDDAPHPR